MADTQKKIIGGAIALLVIAVAVFLVVKNLPLIQDTFKIGKGKCKENETPFMCVKRRGARLSPETGVGERYDYPPDPNNEYGFYPNNRAVRFRDNQKGSYDKEKITWDNGSETTLKEVFKS